MNRILIEEFPTMIVGRLLDNLWYVEDDEEADLADLIDAMKWHLFYTHNRDEYLRDFEDRFMGIPMVRIIASNQTAADTVDRVVPLREFTIDKVERIVASMEQSASPDEIIYAGMIEVYFLFRNNVGAGAVKVCDCMMKPTAVTQRLENIQINCAAFALAYAKKVSYDKTLIKQEAIKIQELCNFGKFVEASQIKEFVKHYQEYRVTVLLPGIDDHSRFLKIF